MAVAPLSVSVGASAAVSVALSNVPAGGYTSAEFTCTYNGSLASAGNIVTGSLFGADAVAAINGPQNGSFIVAIAGSNGNKDTTSGNAFTFGLTGLQAGQTAITCTARVSNGDSQLVAIAFSPASLTITGNTPTPTRTVTSTAKPTATATATAAITATTTATIKAVTATPTITATTAVSPTATPTVTATRTSAPPVITSTATSTASPTPTATISGVGTLTGKVLAGKPVAVGLYRADKSLATSVPANADGTFSLSAPAGSYIAVAAAPGFLSAQGAVTLTVGSSASLPTVSLVAGDIDNNNVIDQFDAMTIGMNYNTATPATADLNKDGVINVLDLEILARNYRKTGPILWQ